VDHILFFKGDVTPKVNPNEVAAVKYVTPDALKELFEQSRKAKDTTITPWFELIANRFLFQWWPQLDTIIANKGLGATEAAKVHKM
jgi:isopentenyl-diphosphate delta-isomerase